MINNTNPYQDSIEVVQLGVNGFRTYYFKVDFVSPNLDYEGCTIRIKNRLHGNFVIESHRLVKQFGMTKSEVNARNKAQFDLIKSPDMFSLIFGEEAVSFLNCSSAEVDILKEIDGVQTWKSFEDGKPSSAWLCEQINWTELEAVIRNKLIEYFNKYLAGVAFEEGDE